MSRKYGLYILFIFIILFMVYTTWGLSENRNDYQDSIDCLDHNLGREFCDWSIINQDIDRDSN